MKRSKIILGILILSVVTLVLSGCGEGDLVTPPPPEENGTYALGDIGPAGGYIFYDKGSYSDGWRYLEAALSDQSTGIRWYNESHWWVTVTGATGTAIGTGQANTTAIVAAQGAGSYAAQLCNDLTLGGYSDWFLPSKDELNLMYQNLKLFGVGGFADDIYWSSSESGSDGAWLQYFNDGSQDICYFKEDPCRVRAVRAFRSAAPTYLVNYNANGATGGTVPSDSYHYEPEEAVTVLDNTGNLVKTGWTFAGWNTQTDGNGTDRTPYSIFYMGNDNVTLYAKGVAVISIPAIPGVTKPVTGANPVDTITETNQYTGTVAWIPTDTPFVGATIYIAWITLTPKEGFTLTGVATNFFSVEGATIVANATNSGTVVAVFPRTLIKIGDSCYGGIVAYILQSEDPGYVAGEQHGLIAAADNQSDGIAWITGGSTQTTWVNYTNYGGTSTDYGTGQANTNAMLAMLDPGCTGGAAKVCDDYENTETGTGVYTDWFLPSKDELNLMYQNLKLFGVGGFADDYYWSSSEDTAYDAVLQSFDGGYQGDYHKDGTLRVRAVRAF